MTTVAPAGYVVTKRDIIHRRDCTTNPINASIWLTVLSGDRACARCLRGVLPKEDA